MDLYEIQELLDDVTFRPFAQHPWEFFAEELEGDLVITLIQHLARDTKNFDPFAEIDDWTMLDGGTQTFRRSYHWPQDAEELRKFTAEMAAHALAHEALEWLWWGDDKAYDPHQNPDVAVIL